MKSLLLVGLTATSVLCSLSVYAYSFNDTVKCLYQEPGKRTVFDNCSIEGSSGQGYTAGTITWSDGQITTYSGNFVTLDGWVINNDSATVIEWLNGSNSTGKSCLKSDVTGTVICWWRE